MNVALRPPVMSREQFLDWVQRQEAPFEFDGFRPVPMTGGSRNHHQIVSNLIVALHQRLRGTGCSVLAQGAGLGTAGGAVRYPDALVTCTRGSGADLLIPDVVVVFEVLSPSSGRTDRVDKVREYAGVASIRRYVLLEQTSIAATVFDKRDQPTSWAATILTRQDVLRLPEIGIEVPLAEFYEDVDLPDEPSASDEVG